MDRQCDASGQAINGQPPPNEPMKCPVCGRAVDVIATDDGYEVGPHGVVVKQG
jgi:hypothetical protein